MSENSPYVEIRGPTAWSVVLYVPVVAGEDWVKAPLQLLGPAFATSAPISVFVADLLILADRLEQLQHQMTGEVLLSDEFRWSYLKFRIIDSRGRLAITGRIRVAGSRYGDVVPDGDSVDIRFAPGKFDQSYLPRIAEQLRSLIRLNGAIAGHRRDPNFAPPGERTDPW